MGVSEAAELTCFFALEQRLITNLAHSLLKDAHAAKQWCNVPAVYLQLGKKLPGGVADDKHLAVLLDEACGALIVEDAAVDEPHLVARIEPIELQRRE